MPPPKRNPVKYSCMFLAHMSSALNGTTMLQCFEHSNTIEICNKIMFDFNPALSRVSYRIFSWERGGNRMVAG